MFLNVGLKKARPCLSMGGFWKKKKKKQGNIVCCVQVYGLTGPDGGRFNNMTWNCEMLLNRMWEFFVQWSSKSTCFNKSCMYVNQSHRRGREQEGTASHGCTNLSVAEDAVVQRACGRIAWQCKSKTWELEGDGMTLTRQWTLHFVEGDRHTFILHFQTWALWSVPGEGVPHAIYGCTM